MAKARARLSPRKKPSQERSSATVAAVDVIVRLVVPFLKG
jgi:hypothetical protein